MQDFEAYLDKLTAKAKDMTDFCNIVCNEEMKGDMVKLESEVNSMKILLNECRSIKDHSQTMAAMKSALYELRRQEIIMKCVIEKTDVPVSQPQPQNDYMVSSLKF